MRMITKDIFHTTMFSLSCPLVGGGYNDRDDDSNDDGGDFEGDERNTNWHFLSAWWS